MIGFIALIHTTRNYNQYSATANLRTLQFTVTHTRILSLHQSHSGNGFQYSNYTSLTVTATHVKSSFHSRTLATQLNSLPSLLNHRRLPSQESPSIIISGGLGSSLYTLGAAPRENTVFYQSLYCSLRIRCRGNLFTESLSSNECLFWLSGVMSQYKNWWKLSKENEYTKQIKKMWDKYNVCITTWWALFRLFIYLFVVYIKTSVTQNTPVERRMIWRQ
jgi:hypothetical protein